MAWAELQPTLGMAARRTGAAARFHATAIATTVVLGGFVSTFPCHAQTGSGSGSGSAVAAQPYAGQNARAVSTLSVEDVDALLAGRGWGLAKPAELNGYPGPSHVLELSERLELTSVQRRDIERIFKRMQLRARSIGARYVAAEQALDAIFKSDEVRTGSLQTRLRDAERLRAELRRAHLQAHIETAPILTAEQRRKYAELRGYGTSGADHGTPSSHKH